MKKKARSRPGRGIAAALRYLEPHTNKQYDTQRRVFDAFSLKRRNPKLSATQAAHQAGTTLRTMRRYGGPALEVRSGRIGVKPTDRIPRRLRILIPSGPEAVTVCNSRDASRVSRHHQAVRQALLSFGTDTDALDRFAGKTLKAGGKTYEFVSDYATLVRFARAGVINFLDIYQSESAS
jgi:hypothetical protein